MVQCSIIFVTGIKIHVSIKRSKKRKLMSYCMKHISKTWTNALPVNGEGAKAPLFAQETATGYRLIV